MSMQTPFAVEIPEETRRLVETLLAAEGVQRLVGNEIDQIISDGDLGDMYATEGGPVAFVPAMRQDNHCLAAAQDRLIERGIPPGEQQVDQAYMGGRHMADSLRKGIDLRGYVREGNCSKHVSFRLRAFKYRH